MKPRHSASLLLVWRVAEFEARNLKAPFLEPGHLLLGLCKIIDLDLPELVSKETPDRDAVLEELLRETRRLREVFRTAAFDARKFRRTFRRTLTTGSSVMETRGRLHRTDDAKDAFAAAERTACLGDGTVFPVHLLHRDIKPQNILVGYEPDGLRARVSDFGLAKKVNPLTLLATAAGTLQFKPPEAFTQRKADSPAADVWAIGTTLYLLLTDRLPVEMPEGTTWSAKNLFDKPITLPTQVNPDISKGLERVVMRTLEKSPEKRFPTARELLHELEAAPLHDPGPAPRKSLSSEATKTVLGNPSPMDASQARTLVDKALDARRGGRLGEAADLMEEAFNKSPDLRDKYAHQVKLWRCGISM